MLIKCLELENFRNHKKSVFEFSDTVTMIIGPNGAGKTNLLEAIALLSVGKAIRGGMESDLVNIDSGFARIVGVYEDSDHDEVKLEAILNKKINSNRITKTFKFNGAQKTGVQFVGQSKVVFFAPEDIRLIAGSPSRRRDFVDRILSQVHRDYHKALLKYERVIKHRNKVLNSVKGQVLRSVHDAQLMVWDAQLLESADIVQAYRNQFFNFSDKNLKDISTNLFSKGLSLSTRYTPSHLSKESLLRSRQRDLKYGTTQLGHHRDDYSFMLNNHQKLDLKHYGSRGQQRTGVFCMKILEEKYMVDQSKISPLLLLDDIFSELDEDYRKSIETVISSNQTIITSADVNSIPYGIKNNAKIITL